MPTYRVTLTQYGTPALRTQPRWSAVKDPKEDYVHAVTTTEFSTKHENKAREIFSQLKLKRRAGESVTLMIDTGVPQLQVLDVDGPMEADL